MIIQMGRRLVRRPWEPRYRSESGPPWPHLTSDKHRLGPRAAHSPRRLTKHKSIDQTEYHPNRPGRAHPVPSSRSSHMHTLLKSCVHAAERPTIASWDEKRNRSKPRSTTIGPLPASRPTRLLSRMYDARQPHRSLVAAAAKPQDQHPPSTQQQQSDRMDVTSFLPILRDVPARHPDWARSMDASAISSPNSSPSMPQGAPSPPPASASPRGRQCT
jgi:hypothetical protein